MMAQNKRNYTEVAELTTIRITSPKKAIGSLVLFFVFFISSFAHAIQVGDRVQSTDNLNIRNCYFLACSLIGTASTGSYGTVTNGPYFGDSYTWWYISWDTGSIGYSVENWLSVVLNLPGNFTLTNESPVCDTNPPGPSPAVRLNWTSSSDAATYDIYRNGGLYSSSNTGTSFYNSANVIAGQNYNYFIRAINSAGTRDSNTISVYIPSNICPTVPSTPTGLIANDFSNYILITWTDNSNNESGFKVERRVEGSASWSEISSASQNSTFYQDYGATPGVTYYRVYAYNSAGNSGYSNEDGATLPVSVIAPTSITGTCQVNGPDSALLFGTVNPNGAPTTAWFQWGTSTAYSNATSSENISNGTTVVQVTHQISGLSVNATYHFRIVGQNSGGTTNGVDLTCTMPPPTVTPPTVVTNSATSVTSSSAILQGTLNPNGAPSTGWFQWGTSTSFGNSTPQLSGGSGSNPVSMSIPIAGLTSDKTFYYRAVGNNSAGTIYGSTKSFSTALVTIPTPVITSISPTPVDVMDVPITLTISGIGFTPSSQVLWKDSQDSNWHHMTETFVNNTTLKVNINSFGSEADTWTFKVENADNIFDEINLTITKNNLPLIETEEIRYDITASKTVEPDKSAVVITHGWKDSMSATWVNTLALAICNSLQASIAEEVSENQNFWNQRDDIFLYCKNANTDVYIQDWSSFAEGKLVSLDMADWASQAWNRAQYLGEYLGFFLGTKKYKHVHLIAHSAGSNLINNASLKLKMTNQTVTTRLTFLDPYHPLPHGNCKKYKLEGTYGLYADWVENYFETCFQFDTDLILKTAFNYDVTAMSTWDCLSLNFKENHGFPIDFYIDKIIQSGYPNLSKKSSNGSICKYDEAGDCSPVHITQFCQEDWLDHVADTFLGAWGIEVGKINISLTGSVLETISNTSGKIVDLLTGSPVWFEWKINTLKKFNALEFDYVFHNGAEGYLTAYLDGIPIRHIDERLATPNKKESGQTLYFSELEPGPHSLGFRIDPYSAEQSKVTISNIRFKQIEKQEKDSLLCFPVKNKNGNISITCF